MGKNNTLDIQDALTVLLVLCTFDYLFLSFSKLSERLTSFIWGSSPAVLAQIGPFGACLCLYFSKLFSWLKVLVPASYQSVPPLAVFIVPLQALPTECLIVPVLWESFLQQMLDCSHSLASWFTISYSC